MQGNYFNTLFFRRFLRVLRVLFPRWRSVNVLLFVTLLAVVLLKQFVIYRVGLIPSQYYRVLGQKDFDGFITQTIYALLIIISIAFIYATEKYAGSVFYVTSRKILTKYLNSKYFCDIFYYHLNVLDDTIDNPDQRITQDVEKTCRWFSSIIAELLISPFVIAYYMYNAWITTGYLGPLCVFVFFIVSTIINKFLMSPVAELVFRQERLEGNFRYKHMMIRSNAESAAFYRCGKLELRKTDRRLEDLIRTQQRLLVKQYGLNFSVYMADYLGSIFSYIIVAIPIFSGFYDDLSPTDLSALISQVSFVTIYLISCFTRLIDMAITVADLAGTTHRIGELMERLAALEASGKRLMDSSFDNVANPAYTGSANGGELDRTVAYNVDQLTYHPPGRADRVLVRDLSFRLDAGSNLLITGDSGCGKSSLLRVMDGLWAAAGGTITKTVCHGHSGVLFLPQKPFLTDGTLREQIMFPYQEANGSEGMDDGQILEYLKQTDLMSLHDRIGGLDVYLDWNWYDVMSPGEMQRLSFVRLFYHQPPFAVLDEATSQIGLAMERTLYTTCREMSITLASIGHRESLRDFHDVELKMDGKGGWALEDIQHSDKL